MTEQGKGNLYIFIAAVIWSSGGVLIKFVPWNPLMINGIRSLIAFFFFAAIRRSFKIKINPTIMLAAICLSSTTLTFVIANKLTTAANAIVLQYLSPIFVLIMVCASKKKLPSIKQTGVVLTAFAGMVLFFCDKLDSGHLLGNMVAVVSGITYAGLIFVNGRPEANNDDSSMIAFLLSFIIFAAAAPFINLGPLELSPSIITAVIALGAFQIGLAYYVFGRGIKRTGAVNASLIGLFEAVLNPFWVFLIIGERPGSFALLGGVLILGAVIFNIIFVKDTDEKGAVELVRG